MTDQLCYRRRYHDFRQKRKSVQQRHAFPVVLVRPFPLNACTA